MRAVVGSLAASLLIVSWACASAAAQTRPSDEAAHDAGRLVVRPHPPRVHPELAGVQPLALGDDRDGLVYVPPSYRPGHPTGLLLLLHGATGSGARVLRHFREPADRAGVIVVAPDARGRTWDVVVDRAYGPDVAFIDRALERVFDRYDVDPDRIAIGGFSDGASYALSLGLANGTLFGSILAFSPGFAVPRSLDGKPRLFVAHGQADSILPIDTTSRRLVPALRQRGYAVRYVEFKDDHRIRGDVVDLAFSWLASDETPDRPLRR